MLQRAGRLPTLPPPDGGRTLHTFDPRSAVTHNAVLTSHPAFRTTPLLLPPPRPPDVPGTLEDAIARFGRQPDPLLPGCEHHHAVRLADAYENGEPATCRRCNTWGSLVVHGVMWTQEHDRRRTRLAKNLWFTAAALLSYGVRVSRRFDVTATEVECLVCGAMLMTVDGAPLLTWQVPSPELRQIFRRSTG